MLLTAEDIAARLGVPVRTARYRLAQWYARGWPRVYRQRRDGEARWRLYVDACDFRAWLDGEAPPHASAA